MSPAKFNERLLSEPKIINIFGLKDVFIVAVAASECEYEGSKSRQTPDLNKSLGSSAAGGGEGNVNTHLHPAYSSPQCYSRDIGR